MADSNPGNFANRPKEEVRAAASKGGKASSSTTDNSGSDNSGTGKQGFASMDPERQVTRDRVDGRKGVLGLLQAGRVEGEGGRPQGRPGLARRWKLVSAPSACTTTQRVKIGSPCFNS
ncbi:hypothetical protein RB599_006202 [Gaeumannomyces hyphopodioides]